ncbi:heterocyst frequency control protein PatD [Dolichospermum sp. ST_con]|nr:heterocyst frequency control protein PatD [Dolichospermum sp. ST_con]MDD1419343.1 heterocyst frequency control protein PatD [Dolichospermum sp. ST_sed1]MDD1423239.1 heterocyst frequency control protein PatD [Dolichospermum sp. ST_sed9]MDD1431773.1 heterocyst frequency control protein PatD [Dolichospermum sp. ST_sed6]MDD1438113.1 heterocyst frequency control protein PatD [Dolichospermum sp. ST_sed10]MDD1438812.1 heterocyst frequency control protein PatD [Dolichospermum sp. ST_sed3]MDD144471
MSFNCDKYQELATFIDEFRANVTGNKLNAGELRENLAQLQEFFGQQIVPLVDANSREQSYKTEINKQLRLLEVDMMFLQGARQSTTSQSRLKTIEERIDTLIRYCQAITQAVEEKE